MSLVPSRDKGSSSHFMKISTIVFCYFILVTGDKGTMGSIGLRGRQGLKGEPGAVGPKGNLYDS